VCVWLNKHLLNCCVLRRVHLSNLLTYLTEFSAGLHFNANQCNPATSCPSHLYVNLPARLSLQYTHFAVHWLALFFVRSRVQFLVRKPAILTEVFMGSLSWCFKRFDITFNESQPLPYDELEIVYYSSYHLLLCNITSRQASLKKQEAAYILAKFLTNQEII
jgi:hypothetical protein